MLIERCWLTSKIGISSRYRCPNRQNRHDRGGAQMEITASVNETNGANMPTGDVEPTIERYVVRRPGCTAWTTLTDLSDAIREATNVNKCVAPNHKIYAEFTDS